MKRTLLAALAAALAAAPGASATHIGGDPKFTTNFYFNCRGDHSIGVPNGHRLVLRVAWGAKNRGLVQDFLNAVEMRAVVAGVEVADPNSYWSAPERSGDLWLTRWVYDTGIVVTFDNPFWIEVTSTAHHRLLDGLTTDEDSSRPFFWDRGQSLVDTDGPCFVGAF